MIDEPEARRFAGRPASVHCWRPEAGAGLPRLDPILAKSARGSELTGHWATTDDMIADLIAGGLSWRLAFWCY